MDSLDVHRRQGADKRWQPEETPTIQGDHMGERGLGRQDWEDLFGESDDEDFEWDLRKEPAQWRSLL